MDSLQNIKVHLINAVLPGGKFHRLQWAGFSLVTAFIALYLLILSFAFFIATTGVALDDQVGCCLDMLSHRLSEIEHPKFKSIGAFFVSVVSLSLSIRCFRKYKDTP